MSIENVLIGLFYIQFSCQTAELYFLCFLIALFFNQQVHMIERDKQKLQVWSRIMPFRESFAWAIIPLFDNSISSASGGSASPSSPLAPSVSGSGSQEAVGEPMSRITLDGKLGYSSGNSVLVEVSNLNKVKDCYTEDMLEVWWKSGHTFTLLCVCGVLLSISRS